MGCLQFYKLTKSTEKNVFEFEIRKFMTAECGCMITYSINQLIVRFERIVSGQFSPLTAPLPLTRPLAPAPSRSTVFFQVPLPLRSRSSGFRARSAHMLWLTVARRVAWPIWPWLGVRTQNARRLNTYSAIRSF